jgi:molybdate transport system substrate-binding protein
MNRIRKTILCGLLLLFVMTVSGAQGLVYAEELTVSAAISLKNAFEEAGRLFEGRHQGTRVLFNFGASGDLSRQIAAGAPVDVFASAALKDMDDLERQGLVRPGTRINFVGNTMVLVVPSHTPVALKTFQDLKDPRIKRIAIGNPQTVPAGRYAQEVLTYFKLWEPLKEKLVQAENVRQVLDYTARKEVEAGLVYSTDARTRAKEIKVVAIAPEDSHKPILYPLALVQGTKKEAAAKTFVDLLLSKEGKEILQRYGFRTF